MSKNSMLLTTKFVEGQFFNHCWWKRENRKSGLSIAIFLWLSCGRL